MPLQLLCYFCSFLCGFVASPRVYSCGRTIWSFWQYFAVSQEYTLVPGQQKYTLAVGKFSKFGNFVILQFAQFSMVIPRPPQESTSPKKMPIPTRKLPWLSAFSGVPYLSILILGGAGFYGKSDSVKLKLHRNLDWSGKKIHPHRQLRKLLCKDVHFP